MSELHRERRQLLLREAEGYLDMTAACGDQFVLSDTVRHQLAQRALNTSLESVSDAKPTCASRVLTRPSAAKSGGNTARRSSSLSEAAEVDSENTHIWLALGLVSKSVSGDSDLAIEGT